MPVNEELVVRLTPVALRPDLWPRLDLAAGRAELVQPVVGGVGPVAER